MNELVQTTDARGVTQWVRRSTGELVSRNQPPHGHIKSFSREVLFASEPLLYEKLTQGRALSWYELARVTDVLTRAASMDAACGLMDSRSMKEILRCIEVMGKARALCEKLNPLGRNPDMSATRTSAQQIATQLLTLPQ